MKEITILSGKGGTGKTSITAALVSLARNAVFCDCDVDAADLHLIMNPETRRSFTYASGSKALIDKEKCSGCGICFQNCRFEAIMKDENDNYVVNPFQCEGCGLCERLCPEKAIITEKSQNNHWYISDTRFGTFLHARMGPGEENSGKLVARLRKKAREIAVEKDLDFIINDGPPGIGCPVISALTGTDSVLMVLEPSKSGFHDAKRLLSLLKNFDVKVYALINKMDLNSPLSIEIERYLKQNAVILFPGIPFDNSFTEAMIESKTITEFKPDSSISRTLSLIWDGISNTHAR
ncbi:MAG: ATP-binding protein [Bacteroidota bacterium]